MNKRNKLYFSDTALRRFFTLFKQNMCSSHDGKLIYEIWRYSGVEWII